ncbi:MAG: BatA domain-containing protein [Polymorphobacter sp.]
MPALLLPAALAALTALLLPLLVHLARRSEERPTDFAALRWLREKPRPKSRLRFDEWLLLAARLLIIALLAVWLARPVLTDSADLTPVVAVLPGVTAAALPGTRQIWLAPGFPDADTPPPPEAASVFSLVRQLDSELAPGVPLRIIVPAVVQIVDAQRPVLSRAVTWQVVDGTQTGTNPLPNVMQRLQLRTAPGPDHGLRYIRAALTALTPPGQPPRFTTAADTAPLPDRRFAVVRLAPGPLPARLRDWITAGGTALVGHDTAVEPGPGNIMWRDAVGAPVVEGRHLGAGRLLRFTRPLTPAAFPDLLEPGFPRALAAVFIGPPPPPNSVAARDVAPTTGAPPWPQPARDLQPWLALAIAALFLAERWLATRRARAVSP